MMACSGEPDPVGLRRVAAEQAALRRVATLVASGAAPSETFGLVAAEVGRLFNADIAVVFRYEPDRTATVAGLWSMPGVKFPGGARLCVEGIGVTGAVLETGRPTRTERFEGPAGSIADCFAQLGVRSGVGAPISVEGRLWGAVVAVVTRRERLSADSEASIAGFTELAATAIANAQARVELRDYAEEQAALRRVALLVARSAAPEEVFAAVAEEAGRLLGAHYATMARYGPDGTIRIVASWSSTGTASPVGTRVGRGGQNVFTLVFQTGRAARIDEYAGATGQAAEDAREFGLRSSVGVPISVEGRLWGAMIVGSANEQPLSAGTEARLTGFTRLAATAIANAQARVELRGFAEEQAALRRVATLVARAAPPDEVFAAVTAEAGRLLGAHHATMARYDPDGTRTLVATWSSTGAAIPVGARASLGGQNVNTLVFQTGRAARVDDYAAASGPSAEDAREIGLRAAVAVPISVEGRLWGAMGVGSMQEPLPAGSEARLAGFTELVATAIANAEAQAELGASRARVVATADATRRRIERNLHDGAQQHLVSLALQLRAAQAEASPGAGVPVQRLDGMAAGLTEVLEELREIAQGLHPAILAERGLGPALKALARRSAVPVRLDIRVKGRLPEQAEIAAYYVVAEALTNTAKHAHATAAEVEVAAADGMLHVCVRDDGRGGADLTGGSGLVGLRDRVEALGGKVCLDSPVGAGTTLHAELPVTHATILTSS
jgi:signal transduction histidine kinase